MVIVEEIQYIIDQMREQGEFTGVVKPLDLPCDVVFNCDPCSNVLNVGLNKWYNKAPYYYFGTKEEILRRLSSKENELLREQQLKYPAIIVEMPFKESNFTDNPTAELSVIFCNNTNVNWTYSERYDNNIKPIIYPLLDSFMRAVKQSDNVQAYEFTDKMDAPFYGDGKVIANDYLDLVLIKTKITFFNNNCKKQKICT